MTALLTDIEPAALEIVHYPDPRLREVCGEVERVDDRLRAVIDRMFELMFHHRGVGLAGPQVGLGIRLFVASPTFEPEDRRVYVNPRIVDVEGSEEAEEGCLSLPGVACKVKRAASATIRALNRAGEPFEETGEGLTARIFQHETDHLDGRLLVDRMGSVAKLANRRALRDLEEQFST